MTNQEVLQLARQVPSFLSFTALPYVCSILAHGSLARGEYLDGWSDIDLLILTDGLDTELYSILPAFQEDLEETLGIKVGIEVLDYRIICKSMQVGAEVFPIFKYIKNCCIENKYTENGILYIREGFHLPRPSIQLLEKLPSYIYAYEMSSEFNKLFKSHLQLVKKKPFFRRLIKYNIYIMQYYLFYLSKKYTFDYEAVIDQYENTTGADVSELRIAFHRRHEWGKIRDVEIDDKDIKALLALYVSVLERLVNI